TIDGLALKASQHSRNGGEIVGPPGRQFQQRKNQIVVPQILPQVIKGPIVKYAVSAAQQHAARAEEVIRSAHSHREIRLVGAEEFLVTGTRGFHDRSAYQLLSQSRSGTELNQSIL